MVNTRSMLGNFYATFLLISPAECKKRPCMSRWFGKLTPGSLRGSILALLATAVGSGVLSLPYVALKSGVIIAAFLLILGGGIALISMRELIRFSNIK